MNLNATLIAQIVVFLILWAFTMKFVWPPITKALDERASKIAGGLAAADKAKAELASANQRVQQELAQSREDIAKRIADAEKRARADFVIDTGTSLAETREAVAALVKNLLGDSK